MSFTEVLEAVKALPRSEKVQLLNSLMDDVGGSAELTPDEVAYLSQFATAGIVHTGWQITTDEAGYRAIEQMIADTKALK